MSTTPFDRAKRKSNSLFGYLMLTATVALACLAVALVLTNTSTDQPAEANSLAGSGSDPDGYVDEVVEGLDGDTQTDDFIDSSSATQITEPTNTEAMQNDG
ncbi:hypothetical protein [Nereida sp. MMG025]|uniref:hypothetical protein n=1 Tax=Nereida sp. MMG025 TaxID=2909981 RepID=UPI001F3DD382|nr:hypothetical protein [Nereida sp. MMG025]MCF6444411.1 hypothetical protein [Nereida sp. MMG025]